MKIKINEQLQGSDQKYIRLITKLELKIKELLEMEQELIVEINELKNKLAVKINDYNKKIEEMSDQIKYIQEFQKDDQIDFLNENNKEILNKRNLIAEKYMKINKYLSKFGDVNSQKKKKLINDYLDKVQTVI